MTYSPEQIVIYVGPSLQVSDARAILDADYRPPVRRGDIADLMKSPPKLVGIIDGKFFQSFAISPKEILPALEAGVTILGSSSMGALRAVELHRYGMIGVGRIFELFHTRVLEADDEVAMAFDPDSGKPVSVPMVNIRLALEQAVSDGVVSAESGATLRELVRAVYFPNRSYPMMLSLAEGRIPESERLALRAWLKERSPDAKRDDAILLLHEVRRLAGGQED
ncbi:TfuA-related McrA-glycine thioamidation protein [Nannocystaceae bacterium ST9]